MPIRSQEGQASFENASQDRANPYKAPELQTEGRHVRVRFAGEDSDLKSQEAHRANFDMKHHPFKRAYPDRRYCHAFDVYSLGIALLEIGLWTPVESLYAEDMLGPNDPFDTRRKLIRIAQQALLDRCGGLYTKVTASCLSVDPEDSEKSLMEQRELCARTAADLAQCQV
ncbi:hypothetical protein VC83_01257 [Pseudogymnoascus destructans]|uniref:Protein kinase domain-containing protein n=1 Tax=Pseudogymnoascus destructans TaxID=655981 RepID=A0A177AK65_9PEZI|nr:uncharacterized protein VC83_01257 [Pseudogymnoascus destructans]OAF62456.1 hypothetical protein VC83_01257 [Pseudogymnoascus destructans]